MSGLKVLEGILKSLDEAKSFGVKTFREVVFSPGASRIRNVLYAGTVLGVQEFRYHRVESLIGEEVSTKTDDFCGDPDNSAHLYRVMNRLHSENSHARSVVFKKVSYSRKKSGVFEVHSSFDSVCRDYDVRFTERLKPSVKYSIVTPVVKIEFPVYGSWRGSPVGAGRSTDETAIINTPFSVILSSELSDVLEFFNPEQTSQEHLYHTEDAIQQANRVVKAVGDSSEFGELTEGYVRLSSEIDEREQQEHRAGIGTLS